MQVAVQQILTPQPLHGSPDTFSNGRSAHATIIDVFAGVSSDAYDHPEVLEKAVVEGHWYDCSPLRAGVAGALDLRKGTKVLEIGGRAGVLTRYLAEKGCSVTAVEGNADLLQLAWQRCRGLDTVQFVRDLKEVAEGEQFDYVFCIDVAFDEQAAPDPVGHLLTQCRNRLRATGTLVFAAGNPMTSQGVVDVQLTSDHVRGSRFALNPLVELIAETGFSTVEPLLAFPHHVAPVLLVAPERARERGVDWFSSIGDAYQLSSSTKLELASWWQTLRDHRIESEMAPGWVILAHRHRVHDVLLPDGGVVKIELRSSHDQASAQSRKEGYVTVVPLEIGGSAELPAVARAARPLGSSLLEYRSALDLANARIEELLQREHSMVASFSKSEGVFHDQLKESAEKARASLARARLEEERAERLEQACGSLATKVAVAEARVHDLEGNLARKTVEMTTLAAAALEMRSTLVYLERELASERSGFLHRVKTVARRLTGK